MSKEVRYEQAVYGSFRFWNRGYGILARSAGCRETWLQALRLAAQRFGERPTGVCEHICLFTILLPGGPWMIVGVFPQGDDDQGRPGALAFHGLFVSRWSYWRSGSNPLPFSAAVCGSWRLVDCERVLPAGRLVPAIPTSPPVFTGYDRVERIVEAINQRRRVVIPSARPIDELAGAVWAKLTARTRRRATLATWAFSTANGFDLAAVPRWTATSEDPSVLIFHPEEELVPASPSSREIGDAGERHTPGQMGPVQVDRSQK